MSRCPSHCDCDAVNPNNAGAESYARGALEATRSLGQQLHVLSARTEQEIDAAFARLAHLRVDSLVVAPDPFFNVRREQIVGLAARHAVPAIVDFREFAAAGDLMSYGPSLSEVYRQAGIYTGKILDGAKPRDLPVLRPTNVELVINQKTAKDIWPDDTAVAAGAG